MNIDIYEKLITPNKFSRPSHLKRLGYIGGELHWVQNPGSTALNNISFFELRKDGKHKHGGAHYLVNLDGKKYRCIPEIEVTYSSGTTNKPEWVKEKFKGESPHFWTLPIEMCHPDMTGKPTEETYQGILEVMIYLSQKYAWTSKNWWLHSELDPSKKERTGEHCPKYFMENPDEWIKLKSELDSMLKYYQEKNIILKENTIKLEQ